LTVALYPGSFDPATRGHVDIAVRAAAIFDQLIIGVFDAPPKNLLFTTDERVEMFRKSVDHLPNVRVEPYNILTVEYAKKLGAKFIVRGLRMGSDFEREFDMALMNKTLDPNLDTICLMSSAEYQFVSASLLKEVVQGGGDASAFVNEHVISALKEKFINLNI
jgi:pantetheine-phosphate adenylyltransferase